jgi:hypothetical protein
MIEDFNKLNQEDVSVGLSPELAQQLRDAKPETVMRAEFQSALRKHLVERASSVNKNINYTNKESWIMTWNKFFLGFGTSLAVVALAWFAMNGSIIGTPKNAVQVLSGEYKVTSQAAGSFGSLTSATNNAELAQGGDTASRPQSGGGSSDASSVTMTAPAPGGMGGGGDGKMIAPYPEVQYKFKYTGGSLPALVEQQEVFKRIKGIDSNSASSIIGSIKLGLFNLQRLTSTALENITLTENRENGYSVNLNFVEGSASFYENWRMWSSPDQECRDNACFNRNRLKISDVPEDAKILAIADQFLNEYQISKDRYGAPVINDYWRQEYNRTPDKANYYIPDVISVVYPYIVGNTPVFDEGGMPTGLNVSVNIRKMLVSSVGEITTQQYFSSYYAGLTDERTVIDLAEKGGFRYYYGYPLIEGNQVKTTTIELGTPISGMMRFWKYDNYGSGDELYAPALIFPVLNKTETGYYRDNVVVPLVKEIIENDNQPPITIMESASASPAEDAPVQIEVTR